MSGKYGHSVLLSFSLRIDIKCSIVLEKTYILDQTKLWECRLMTNYDILRQQQARFQIFIAIIDVVPQINKTAICTKYLKDGMPGHQNLSRGSNDVPRCIKRQGTRIKKNASTTSQNYLCIYSVHCPYLP